MSEESRARLLNRNAASYIAGVKRRGVGGQVIYEQASYNLLEIIELKISINVHTNHHDHLHSHRHHSHHPPPHHDYHHHL